jgi:hypothetical protein
MPNHDKWAAANLRFERSLQGKKSPCRRFLEILSATRNKLLDIIPGMCYFA